MAGYRKMVLPLVALLAAHSGAWADSSDDVAVVIGNRNYRKGRVPAVEYAFRDAEAFAEYLRQVRGFRPENIILLRDAGQAEMEAVLGNGRNPHGRLWQVVKPGKSEVTVFYSGHGAPGLQDHKGYLMPVDAAPDRAEINGFPVDVLVSNLGRLQAKRVSVYLDSCFSGESPRGQLVKSASPISIVAKSAPTVPGVTVLSAGLADQMASWDEHNRHGLFTQHLLDGLYGKADANRDGVLSGAELKAYLDDTMTVAARRDLGRIQNASISGDASLPMARLPDKKVIDRPGALSPTTPERPPAHAFEACRDKAEGTKVLRQTRYGRFLATCTATPEGLVAVLPKPPPQGFEACRGKSPGDPATRMMPDGPVPSVCVTTDMGLFALRIIQDKVPGSDRPISSEAENLYWASIKESRKASDFSAYLKRYPDGLFADVARSRLEDLAR